MDGWGVFQRPPASLLISAALETCTVYIQILWGKKRKCLYNIILVGFHITLEGFSEYIGNFRRVMFRDCLKLSFACHSGLVLGSVRHVTFIA